MNDVAQSVQSQRSCSFCSRPWFGPVAFCPYCGRKASQPDDPVFTDGPTAIEQGSMGMPADAHHQHAVSSHEEPGEPLHQGVPPLKRDRPAPSRWNKPVLTLLLKTLVAGVTALLFVWMAFELLAPDGSEEAASQQPGHKSVIAAPGPAPSVRAEEVPPAPPRTDTAPPRADTGPPPVDTARPRAETAPGMANAVPGRPSGSLCSPANEAAGLCKSQP